MATFKDMITEYLVEKGYAGLIGKTTNGNDCECDIEDLFSSTISCDAINCEPGYFVKCHPDRDKHSICGDYCISLDEETECRNKQVLDEMTREDKGKA